MKTTATTSQRKECSCEELFQQLHAMSLCVLIFVFVFLCGVYLVCAWCGVVWCGVLWCGVLCCGVCL